MKKLLYLLFAILINTICNGQVGFIQPSSQGIIYNLKSVNNNLIIGITNSECHFLRGGIIAIDSVGQLLWEYNQDNFNYKNIFITPDEKIIIAGIGVFDGASEDYSFAIDKLDLNGQWLSGNTIDILFSSDDNPFFLPPYFEVIEHPNENGFLLYSKGVLVTLDSLFNITEYYLDELGEEIGNWDQIKAPYQSQILAYNIDDTTVYFTDTLFLQPIDSIILPKAIKNAYLLEHIGYILHLDDNDLLQITNGQLNSIELPFSSSSLFIAWENTSKDRLFVSIPETKLIWEWDGINWQSRPWPEDERMQIWGGEYRKNTDEYWFSGSITPFTLNEARFIYSAAPPAEDLDLDLDLAIIDIQQENVEVELYKQILGLYFFNFNYELKVTIKNLSDTVIQNFSLKDANWYSYECYNHTINNNQFFNLNLLPGEERAFNIILYQDRSFTEENLPENHSQEFCFSAFAPNNKFDVNLENNTVCINTNAIITNTETIFEEAIIALSPNPSNGAFKMEANSNTIESWTLYNAIGQVIKQAKKISSKTVELHFPQIPKGIYFMEIQLKNGTIKVESLLFE